MSALRAAALAVCAWFAPCCAWAACPAGGHDAAALAALKRDGVVLAEPAAREALAFAAVECLASTDPAVRDGLAYETLRHWLRDGAFPPDTLRRLRARALAVLDAPDPDGVARPFAALTLAEIARTDRIAPWMRGDERTAMVQRASAYLASVTDYRGYEAGVGWRHGVAHGADWAMQLALNPALARADLDALAQAVAAQAVPASGHAYVFGEPERLARPLVFVARRDAMSAADWRAWFAALTARLGDPAHAWNDAGWLARRHDLSAFAHALYLQADLDEAPGVATMKAALAEAIAAMP